MLQPLSTSCYITYNMQYLAYTLNDVMLYNAGTSHPQKDLHHFAKERLPNLNEKNVA